MKNYIIKCYTFIFVLTFSSAIAYAANSNPASVEYVDNAVKNAARGETGAQGEQGATGPQGEQGATGPQGPQGDPAPSYTVGQQAMGGIVFWTDATGQHGLISAPTDNSTNVAWASVTTRQTLSNRDGIFGGEANTDLIIASQAAAGDFASSAALICANYAIGADGTTACPDPGVAGSTCYDDWSLPTKFALNQLILQKDIVGNFVDDTYWSCTESSAANAWSQSVFNAAQTPFEKTALFRVRCIRAF